MTGMDAVEKANVSCLAKTTLSPRVGRRLGTFTGQWGAVEPTGKAATFSGVNIYRFNQGGKVAEIWNHRDDLGFMEQVGVSVWAGAAPKNAIG